MTPEEIAAWLKKELESANREMRDPSLNNEDFYREQGKIDLIEELLEII